MNVVAICPEGYAVYECTCPVPHGCVRITACPPNHDHANRVRMEIPEGELGG